MAAAATPPTPAQNGPSPGNARAAAASWPAGEPRFAALLTKAPAPGPTAKRAADQAAAPRQQPEVPVAEVTPGTAPAPQEAAPAVLAARLAGQQAAATATAAGTTAETEAPPALTAGGASGPTLPKAAKAAPRHGLPETADAGETDPEKPTAAAEAVPAPSSVLPVPLPPPPTQAAGAPKAASGDPVATDAPAKPGGLAKPDRLPAATAEKPAPRSARTTEAPPGTEPAAPAASTSARDTPPPPPATTPPAPPTATQAAAPQRQAPSASPAQQLAPVVVAVALGQGANGQGSSLTVRLNPGELGQVEVRIDRPADGGAAQVKVVAERPETLALLQRDAPELGRALQQAGIPQDSCRLSFSLGGGQDQAGHGNNQGGNGGQGAANQGAANQGWGGRQARFVTEEIPPPRVATSLLDMSI